MRKLQNMKPSPQTSLHLFSLACTRVNVSKWAHDNEKIQIEGLRTVKNIEEAPVHSRGDSSPLDIHTNSLSQPHTRTLHSHST